MAIRLDSHLDLDNLSPAQWEMLEDLQGNILKGHGRDHAVHHFLHFATPDAGKEYLRWLRGLVTSAADQVRASRRLRPSSDQERADRLPISGQLFVSVALSRKGYEKLEISPDLIPQDPAFQQGMAARGPFLMDPPATSWSMVNEGINERKEIHALVVVACDTAEITEAYSNLLMSRLPEGVHKLAIETGRMWRNAQNQPIEHFGYVDGASSPVFLLQDMEGKQNSWKPSLSPLSLVLDRCPAGDANSFGSYLVFRKLEQNPRMFAEMEVELGKALDMSDDEAGALVVGRRKDGTSVMIEPSTSPGSPTNDFDYSADRDGTTCPLHAHARKLNPRGGTLPDDLRKGVEWERPHWIVRRGMPYGTRRDNPAKPALPQDRPGWGKVGLLFMCYQSSIKTQFELLQGKWANDPTFPGEQSGFKGVDPLIGARATSQRREGRVLQEAPLYRSRSGKPVRFHVRSCVRLQGGEYFFVPSISFFRKL